MYAVLKEIEEEELLFQSSLEKKRRKEAAKAEEQKEGAQEAGNAHSPSQEARVKVESLGGAKFY
jgi:hypothetical protein